MAASAPTSAPIVAPKENLDLADAYLRLRRVTSLSGNEGSVELTPGGDKYIFSATFGLARSLYSLDRDASEPKRLTTAVGVQGLNFAGDQIIFTDAGRAGVVKLAERRSRILRHRRPSADRFAGVQRAESSSKRHAFSARCTGTKR
jgi:hypothetical protein